ncbi:DUF6542 domain-containing protein [Nocardioides dongxiaopingii]|uniref:DUF6542 domain-containing protein n=1 Tax=Nocardioides dongxiaopingii TaxID=2576036 RepID=UPI001BAF668F|nr:DUF6542 domain-containing protein [Nocardioides dongxiaopingii]
MNLPGSRTVWEEGHEPGREMAALGVALALTAAAVDLLLTAQVGLLFDLGFVVLCVGLALAVRLPDFFTVGVLPPLLMLSTFLLLAMSRSEAIARADDGVVQAVISGLSHHAVALALGYGLALVVLVVRQRVAAARHALDGDAADVPAGAEVPLRRSGPGPRLPA